MNFKKKLVMGAMSATLGISLVAGGTWAAFNDVENRTLAVGAGELDLKLDKLEGNPYKFKINNLKPGDFMTRTVVLKNEGTLAIKDVLMGIELVKFTDYKPKEGEAGFGDSDTWGKNNALDFLDQFKVTVAKVGAEGGSDGFPRNVILSEVTLKDFYLASDSVSGDQHKVNNGAEPGEINAARQKVWNSVDRKYLDIYANRLNVATINPDKWTGLPVIPNDSDRLEIKVEFEDKKSDSDRNEDRTFKQNIFQGDTADITVSFEARQWGGLNVQDEDLDSNGSVKTNKEANSETKNP